jgi:hypothetical protein
VRFEKKLEGSLPFEKARPEIVWKEKKFGENEDHENCMPLKLKPSIGTTPLASNITLRELRNFVLYHVMRSASKYKNLEI